MTTTSARSATGQDRKPGVCPFLGNNTQIFLNTLFLPLLFVVGNLFSKTIHDSGRDDERLAGDGQQWGECNLWVHGDGLVRNDAGNDEL